MSGDASTTARARESPPDEVKILQGKLHRFLVDQHQVLAGFAACKYTKNGPGALFVFANVNLRDLLVEPEEPGFDAVRALERQLVLVWGGTTSKAAPDCTLAALSTKLTDAVTRRGIAGAVSEGSDRASFPVILCAGVEHAPEDVRQGLRPPKGSKKYGESGERSGVSVMRLQYGDFRAALTHGLSLNLADALDVDLDVDRGVERNTPTT